MSLRLWPRRRRAVPVVALSTLTPQSGEWWAADGYWTAPLDDRWRIHDYETLVLRSAVSDGVAHLAHRGLPVYHSAGLPTSVMDLATDSLTVVPIPQRAAPNGDGRALFVSHHERRVWLLDGATFGGPALWEAEQVVEASIDDDGPDLPGGGLVLSREIAVGRIRHAVALTGDFGLDPGTRVRFDPEFDIATWRAPHATRTVVRALQSHGGILTGGTGSTVGVACERAVGPVSDDVGPVYREAGWNYDPQPLNIPWEHLSVIVPCRRKTKAG